MWKVLNQYFFDEGIFDSVTNKLENAKMQNRRKTIKSSDTPVIKEKTLLICSLHEFSLKYKMDKLS